MPDLPQGTVTFLFTDIEGSTRLLQQLGSPRYAEALGQHQALLRTAFAAHTGQEVDTQGDAFLVVFPTAPQAVAAAAQATRALVEYTWPAGAAVRVRMGLHTGTPQLVGDHYVGLDVHRAARIAAAGHGGQILLSEATRALAEPDLPAGALLRDLGEFRLKDLQRPERLAQLVLPGLPADFLPLKTLDRYHHNLPIQPTVLLGREEAVAGVCALLRRDDARLVTLTGPGGVGKTRLGLQVAAEALDAFPDGVWFVRLSRLTDPTLVLPTIAQALGLHEAGSQSIEALLREYVRTRHLLLVLDNFEHVVGAATGVAELLATSPGLKVLVTSRVTLHLQGEREYPVPPLTLPAGHDAESPAVTLFVERAQASRPDFTLTNRTAPVVAAICARLDGMPLAIELAAARVKLLPPPALLQRLERRLPLLTGGARDLEERQQTMRNTLAWSEDLLSREEQQLFQRLAVFAGGCALEGAEAVCATPEGAEPLGMDLLEGLGTLVDQSLVWQREETGGEALFGMLQVIREFALEQLEASGEAEALRRAHAAYYLRLAEAAEPELWRSGQVEWLERLEHEHDNLRAALGWAQERGETELGLRLAVALLRFWWVRGHRSEGRSWLEGLLASTPLAAEQSGAGAPAGLRAMGLGMAGFLALGQGDDGPAQRQRLLESGLRLARQADDKLALSMALYGLGAVTLHQGDLERAAAYYEEALEVARELGDVKLGDVQGILTAHTLVGMGAIADARGDWGQAAARYEEALALGRKQGDWDFMAACIGSLGQVARHQGDLEQAVARQQEALGLFRAVGNQLFIGNTLEELAMTAAVAGQAERAARLLGAETVLRAAIGIPILSAERADIEAGAAPARAVLGEAAWAAAFAAGQAMTLEEAITEALDQEGAGGDV